MLFVRNQLSANILSSGFNALNLSSSGILIWGSSVSNADTIFSLVLTLLIIEITFYWLYENSRIDLASTKYLATYLKGNPAPGKPIQPTYIPHPYFGNIYAPSAAIKQGHFSFPTNSRGFLDDELPTKKEDGVWGFPYQKE